MTLGSKIKGFESIALHCRLGKLKLMGLHDIEDLSPINSEMYKYESDAHNSGQLYQVHQSIQHIHLAYEITLLLVLTT